MSEHLVLATAGPGERNGVGDYAAYLAHALGRIAPARLVVPAPAPVHAPSRLQAPASIAFDRLNGWDALQRPPWSTRCLDAACVFIQYFPQAFTALELQIVLDMLRARRQAGRPVVITLHEYWPHASLSPRRILARVRSRRALRRLVEVSTALVVSQPYSVNELVASGLVPRDRLHVIPIGSAIPALDTPGGMAAVSPPVLAMFGQPAMMHPDATATLARWLQAERPPARLWWFSRSEGELRLWWSRHVGGPSEQVTFYGGLPAAEISPRLRAATLGLALYLDGASTRRSSLAALLEHGLPILGLDERYTDDRIRQSEAFALLTANRCRDLPSAAASLLSDPVRRAAMAGAARRFFSCELAWPVIAQAYVELSGRPA